MHIQEAGLRVNNRYRNPGTGGLVAMWPSKKGSVLNVYVIKRSREVLGMMRCNNIFRMQQSKASSAIIVLRYCHFFFSVGGAGRSWEVQGPSLGGPRGVPGGPRRSRWALGTSWVSLGSFL